MRVMLGVAGIRMRQSDYFARPVFHSVANLVKSMEFFTLGGSVRFLLRFFPERRLIGYSEKVYVRRKESVSEDK